MSSLRHDARVLGRTLSLLVGAISLILLIGVGSLAYEQGRNLGAIAECQDRAAESVVAGDHRAAESWLVEISHAQQTGVCRDNYDPRLRPAIAISTD